MILIIGGEGQLGEAFHKKLESTNQDHILAGKTAKKKGTLRLDITDREDVQEIISNYKPDAVINCAAYTAVDKAEKKTKEALRVNAIGAYNVAIACRETEIFLVHFSTDYVFDGTKNGVYSILDSTNPINEYGKTKALGEKLVRYTHPYHCLIRTSWLFSEGHSNFLQKVIQWGINRKELRIVKDQVSSPTYAKDLVDAALQIMDNRLLGLFHITNSGSCSRYEWAQYALLEIGWEGELIPASSRDFLNPARRPPVSVLDNTLTGEILGFEMPHWKDATKRFLENGGWT